VSVAALEAIRRRFEGTKGRRPAALLPARVKCHGLIAGGFSSLDHLVPQRSRADSMLATIE